jgi:hypothetical protein
VVFGTAYGGVTPLFAALTREYFEQRAMRAGVWSGRHMTVGNFLL